MNITTEVDQEVWHDLQEAGAYEWWYFDVEDKASGFSFVLIWFSGFPFSPYYTNHYERWKNRITAEAPLPSNYSGFSFQLYENDHEIVNFIKEGSNGLFESSRSDIGVRFEKNCFTYDARKMNTRSILIFHFPPGRKQLKHRYCFHPAAG
jgi:carotenoid 1,2-hydratase